MHGNQIEPRCKEDVLFERLAKMPDADLAEIARGADIFERGQSVTVPRLRLGPAGVAADLLSLRRSFRYGLNRVISMSGSNLG